MGARPSAGFVQQVIEAQALHPEPQQLRTGDLAWAIPRTGVGELELTAIPSTNTSRAVTLL